MISKRSPFQKLSTMLGVLHFYLALPKIEENFKDNHQTFSKFMGEVTQNLKSHILALFSNHIFTVNNLKPVVIFVHILFTLLLCFLKTRETVLLMREHTAVSLKL